MTILNKLEEAVMAHQAGQLDEAVRLYGIVLDAQPRNPVANYNLGVLSVGIQNLRAALILLRNAIESNPDERQYWLS